jgi:hypothetical protein
MSHRNPMGKTGMLGPPQQAHMNEKTIHLTECPIS